MRPAPKILIDPLYRYTRADSQPIKRDRPGRNDPCPCGSGKKTKKCCPERTRP